MNKLSADQVIEYLELQPLPIEGGYFRVTYTSSEQIPAAALPSRYKSSRNIAGAIYFMETEEQFSAMHRLPTDELYYYHYGDPMEMLLLYPEGTGETRILGPDLALGQEPQILAPMGCIHGSRPLPGGSYGFSLASTSMAPGFADSDPFFPQRAELIEAYPNFSALVLALTRTEPINV